MKPPRRALLLSLLCCAATRATSRAAFADDEPADPRSLAQAAAAAPRLPADARILTSPARAARQTAAALGHEAAEPTALLRDADWGRWRGRTLDEIAAAEPDALATWLADPQAVPHGGESLAAVIDRAAVFLAAGLDRPVLAITHPAILRAALVHALGAPAPSLWRIDAPPLARLDLGWNGRAWTLRRFATIQP